MIPATEQYRLPSSGGIIFSCGEPVSAVSASHNGDESEMDYSTLAILLGIVTLILVVAEFFIPSGGMISVLAVIAAIVSIWGGWQAWGTTAPWKWWVFLGVFLSVIPGAVGVVVAVLPRTKYGRRILLEPTPAPKHLANVKEIEILDQLVGKRGVTATIHAPGGIAEIDGMRYHSESEGLPIDPDTPIEVIGVKGGARLLIREIDESAAEENSQPEGSAEPVSPFIEEDESHETESKEHLDFQVPED